MKVAYLYRVIFCGTLIFGLSYSLAQAQSHSHKPKSKKHKKSVYPERNQTTSGSVTIEGKTTVQYKAIAGTIPLFNSDRDTTAHIFFVGYFKKGVKDTSQRPITFLYNGGPGSSSVWLHMGSFGPKRVNAKDTVHISGAPYQLLNNKYSLLDVTDLVFIDAPGTGFSRLTKKGDPDDFYGVYQDANAFANFIYGFLKKYDRWNSPKYLFGESYGTTRNAVLSAILTNRKNIDLNGVMMLSQILNFDLSIDGPKRNPGNYLPFVLGLPTYAATAWYHHKLPGSRPANLKSFIAKVEKFAKGPYANALAKGSTLSKSQFNQIVQKLHQYTGLSEKYLKKANLRVDGGEFEHQLILDSLRVTGRLDTRFRGPVMNPLGEGSRYDPQSANISSAYISLFNHYVRHTLHFGKHMVYRPSHYGHGWSFKYHGRLLRNVMPYLARAMVHNPKMKVMLNTGYFDLATPFSEGIYELRHLPMPKYLEKNISIDLYKSGHMVYVKPAALKKLRDNVAAFIKKTDNIQD
jgi:carboxypeptidase C (cathepsin A)